MPISISQELAANCTKTPERAAWLERLPDIVETLERRWNLTAHTPSDGEPPSCAYVAAVSARSKTPAVLKIGMPHMEAEDEIAGLRFWNGNPTVRLLASDDQLHAMLLERCQPGTTLRTIDEHAQDVVISALLRRLWRSPSTPHTFRHLSVLMDDWTKETLAQGERRWCDPGLVREGLRLFKELSLPGASDVLLATDLHAGNVLRAEREPWLVIDPKPFVGDPAYDATQHLFNCYTRLKSDAGKTIRRLADLLKIDQERVRLWTFARAAAEPHDDWARDKWAEVARSIAP